MSQQNAMDAVFNSVTLSFIREMRHSSSGKLVPCLDELQLLFNSWLCQQAMAAYYRDAKQQAPNIPTRHHSSACPVPLYFI